MRRENKMVKILGDITEVGTISGSVGAFSDSLTISGVPVSIGAGDFFADGSIPMSGVFRAIDGNPGAPGVTFNNDQDTGLYRVAENVLGITTSGNRTVVISGAHVASPEYFRMIQGGTGRSAEIANRKADETAYGDLSVRGKRVEIEATEENEWLYLHNDGLDGAVVIRASGTFGSITMRATGGSSTVGVETVGANSFAFFGANGPAGETTIEATGVGGSVGVYSNTSAEFIVGTSVNSNAPFRASNGSAASPSLSFTGDDNTGIYRVSADVLGLSAGGATRLTVSGANATTSGVGVQGNLTARSGNFSTGLTVSGIPVSIGTGGITDVVQDTTPQLGGALDAQTFNITNVGTLQATTVTGTTGQFGGTVSADTGTFKNLTGLVEPLDFGWTAAATGTLVLEQYALYPYTINQLTGQTGQGTVSGTLWVNNLIVGGINDQTWSTTASTKTATSNTSVVIGDRVVFSVSGTSNGTFSGFTLSTRRV